MCSHCKKTLSTVLSQVCTDCTANYKKNRIRLTANKLFQTDGQDVVTQQICRMGTDSGDGLLELIVCQPRTQPLHVTVAQEAACVQDTENKKVIQQYEPL